MLRGFKYWNLSIFVFASHDGKIILPYVILNYHFGTLDKLHMLHFNLKDSINFQNKFLKQTQALPLFASHGAYTAAYVVLCSTGNGTNLSHNSPTFLHRERSKYYTVAFLVNIFQYQNWYWLSSSHNFQSTRRWPNNRLKVYTNCTYKTVKSLRPVLWNGPLWRVPPRIICNTILWPHASAMIRFFSRYKWVKFRVLCDFELVSLGIGRFTPEEGHRRWNKWPRPSDQRCCKEQTNGVETTNQEH